MVNEVVTAEVSKSQTTGVATIAKPNEATRITRPRVAPTMCYYCGVAKAQLQVRWCVKKMISLHYHI